MTARRIFSLLIALVMLAGLAGAAAAETVTTETAQLTLKDIETLNGGPVTVHESHGAVTFIGGACTEKPVSTLEDAEAVVASVLSLLGGDGQTRFEPWNLLRDSAGNHYYVFQQVFGDVLAQGGAVKVITDSANRMIGLTGSLLPVPAGAGESGDAPEITAEQAEQIVLDHEKEAGNPQPSLVSGQTMKIVLPVERILDVDADTVESRYVWAVFTTAIPEEGSWTELPYLAHYVTLGGEYLYSLPTIVPGDDAGIAGYDASYVFEFMEPAPYTGYVDFSDGTEREITIDLMRDTRTGMYYLGNIEHKIVVADCWEFLYNNGRVVLEYSPDNLEWDQTGLLSLYQYCRAADYYNAIGWRGGDGEGTPIIVLKDFCDREHRPVDNAAYAGKFYGWQAFLSSSVNDLAQCLDVAAHEFTHCVTHTTMTYNAYKNDFGAINESVSDIMGKICDRITADRENITWTIGELSKTSIRSMDDPNKYKQPGYVWDVFYTPNVKEPTLTNDHGGVHRNSSLLNRIAYLLCAEGGMTLEDARAFWFATDCAMVPGSDFPQLKDLLPWVLKIIGMDRYAEALDAAIAEVRLGDTRLPETIDPDRAVLSLDLPDNEIFNNGKWMLYVISLNIDNLERILLQMMEDLKSGNLEDYPVLLKDLAEATPTPEPERKGLLEALFEAFIRSREEVPETTPAPNDPRRDEFIEWVRGKLRREVFHNDMGSAGQDGHRILMMSKPGKTLPALIYLSTNPEGTMIELAKTVVYINGRWIDISTLLDLSTSEEGKTGALDALSALAEHEFVAELLKSLAGNPSLRGLMDALTLDVKGGQIFELPTNGLEKIDLESGNRNQPITLDGKPNNRKSRPKLP